MKKTNIEHNIRKSIFIYIIISFCFLVVSSIAANACMFPVPIEEKIGKSDVIFLGKIIDVSCNEKDRGWRRLD